MLPCRAGPHQGPLVAGFRNLPIRDYDVPDTATLGLNGHSTSSRVGRSRRVRGRS